jgi:hypothetical protein
MQPDDEPAEEYISSTPPSDFEEVKKARKPAKSGDSEERRSGEPPRDEDVEPQKNNRS